MKSWRELGSMILTCPLTRSSGNLEYVLCRTTHKKMHLWILEDTEVMGQEKTINLLYGTKD